MCGIASTWLALTSLPNWLRTCDWLSSRWTKTHTNSTVRLLCKIRPWLLIAQLSWCFGASGDLEIEGVPHLTIDLPYESLSCIIIEELHIIGLSCEVFSLPPPRLPPSQFIWDVTSPSRKEVEGSRCTEVVDVRTTLLSYVDEKSSSISWIHCDIIWLCRMDIEMPDACEVLIHPYNLRHPPLLWYVSISGKKTPTYQPDSLFVLHYHGVSPLPGPWQHIVCIPRMTSWTAFVSLRRALWSAMWSVCWPRLLEDGTRSIPNFSCNLDMLW